MQIHTLCLGDIMKPELVEAIRSKISHFPSYKDFDPACMSQSKELMHSLVTQLYCGGEKYSELAVAIKTWKPEHARAFSSLINGLKAQNEGRSEPNFFENHYE